MSIIFSPATGLRGGRSTRSLGRAAEVVRISGRDQVRISGTDIVLLPIRGPQADHRDDEGQHQEEDESAVELGEPVRPETEIEKFCNAAGGTGGLGAHGGAQYLRRPYAHRPDNAYGLLLMSPLRYLRDSLVFAPCYIALDWASYIDPVGPFNITPWNPQHGLAIVWLLLGGLHHAPAVLVTVVVAEAVVRGLPGGYFIAALTSLTLTGGFASMAWILRELLPDPGLRSTRHLTLLTAVVVAGTAIVGTAFVGLLRGADLLGATPVPEALLRFWVGDAVGILITAPLLLAVADPERRSGLLALARRPESLAQAGVLVAILWLVFYGLDGNPARLFYLLFVPLIWIAARGGMNGAVVASAIVQIGVVVGIHREAGAALPALELQALMAAFTLTGLFLGMMVDERERAAENLRQSLRLAAAGEMAGAIAHEVNQPLTALSNYGESALMLLARQGSADAALSDIVRKMLQESGRAAEVVRRLRDFFRSGTTRLEALSAEELVATVRRIGQQVLGAETPVLSVRDEAELPALYVDRLQIEVVIRNLIANAQDAIRSGGASAGSIDVQVRQHDAEHLCLVFADSGPGLSVEMRERVFEPFVSGKAAGMGLGLAISRAIAEAHGGSLQARAAAHGEFHLVLPCNQNP
jgi:two-component system sensor kinase FixL